MADKIINYSESTDTKLYELEWYQSYKGTAQAFQWNLVVYLEQQNLTQKTTTIKARWAFRTHKVSGLVWHDMSGCYASLWQDGVAKYSAEIQNHKTEYVWVTLCEVHLTVNHNSDGTAPSQSLRTIWNNTTSYVYMGAYESRYHTINIPSIEVSTRVPLKIGDSMVDSVPYILIGGEWKEAKPYILVNGAFKEGVSS